MFIVKFTRYVKATPMYISLHSRDAVLRVIYEVSTAMYLVLNICTLSVISYINHYEIVYRI